MKKFHPRKAEIVTQRRSIWSVQKREPNVHKLDHSFIFAVNTVLQRPKAKNKLILLQQRNSYNVSSACALIENLENHTDFY